MTPLTVWVGGALTVWTEFAMTVDVNGAAAGFATPTAIDRPLGFVAILGILALLGMITKNAVILIGQIEAERSEGKSVWQATVDASSTRFRPIMLTAISTVLGMIPIAPTVFWGPMAFAIMGGLLVGTILTLVFLPALYVTWFGGKESSSDRRPATAS